MAAKLIIADPDYNYIESYEEELIKRFGERADIQIITQADYLANYFRVHRTVDILIIAREFYGIFVKEHDIGHLLVLDQEISLKMEDENAIPTTELKKFTSVEEEFEFIEKSLQDAPMLQPGQPAASEPAKTVKVISIYSPVGGSGKSLVAFALGKKLKMLEERTIVIGCDDLQSIGVYLENRQHAGESLATALKSPDEDTYWEVLKNISQEEVPCLLPFEKPLSVLEVGTKELASLVELIKAKGDFSYIILDLGCDMNETNRTLISLSDMCIVITEPNVNACRKLEKVVMNQEIFTVPRSLTISNQTRTDGIHLNPEGLFGSISPYENVTDAMEDPLFYRLALEIAE